MTAPMDAVATATAAVLRLYRLNAVPASPAYPYGVFSASLGRGDAYTLDVAHGMRHGRAVVQPFGTTADAALDLMDKVAGALLDVSLAITGYDATPCVFDLEPSVVRDPDNAGVVGVTAVFAFTATKEP